ncbi:hypothetical protein M3Y97_00109000 [Aphelenchoides bicaudatus]|nr:hypothetical protein M3Y97_00109000 [Aphelenchoides bicaudatus]
MTFNHSQTERRELLFFALNIFQLEFRLHLRYELLLQGLDKVIEGIRDEHGQDMENHLDFFDMQRKDDEDELLSLSSNDSASSPPNLLTVTGLAEALNQKLDKTVAQKHLLSVLEHLLILSVDENHLQLWKLYDLILQQLSLQLRMQNVKNVGDEVDAALTGQSLDINIDRIMTKLRSEEECQRLEKECMDKDKRILELENRLSDLQDGFSLSSFSRSSDLGSSSSEVCHSPTPSSSSSVPLPHLPPPLPGQLRSLGGPILNPTAPKKKVPKPMSQVKTLNWTTIPHTKINGTVFENIGDEKLYDKLNLQQICTTFASTKDPGDPGTLHRRIARAAETVPSVIEFRRSQNLNIMLSKLKMSHREIRITILAMDEKGRLPRDMIEQMLKFIPTKDELSALDESLAKCSSPSSLPLADRYLFEVGQIPRFEQRLKCLNIMRSFQERVDSLKPFMTSVTKASTTLSSSNRLKQLMSLLLAIGNYLNFGKRNGNAMGFTIRSLNTVQDVKSVLKTDRTLLHYIIELIEQQFPDLIKLKKELNSLYDATKFTRAETEQEMLDIQTALRYVSNQYNEHLQQQKQKSSENSTEEVGNDSGVEIVVPSGDPKAQNKKTDKFLPTVKSFLNTANKQMSDLEQLNEEMKTKFTKCAAYFCEDSTNTSPDEFFRIFTKFLSQFADCHATVLKERENIEREKRQTISRTMLQRKCGKKQRESGPQIFDMLVSELTKGELFRDDLTRLSQKYPWKKKVTSVQINA